MEYRVFDTDSHINEAAARLGGPAASHLRELGPRVVEMDGGNQGWTWEGKAPTRMGGGDGALAKLAHKVGGMVNVTREMAEEIDRQPARFYEMYRPGNYDANARREDMDIDGVDASIIYPGRGMSLWDIKDPDLRVASMRAYNDWLAEEFVPGAPDRVFWAGVRPGGRWNRDRGAGAGPFSGDWAQGRVHRLVPRRPLSRPDV